jgi:hypothetical protein
VNPNLNNTNLYVDPPESLQKSKEVIIGTVKATVPSKRTGLPPMASEATPVHYDDVGCNLAEGALCIFVGMDYG